MLHTTRLITETTTQDNRNNPRVTQCVRRVVSVENQIEKLSRTVGSLTAFEILQES